jgi:membrane carboxypeptidase/penicillin-binding protein PbpC
MINRQVYMWSSKMIKALISAVTIFSLISTVLGCEEMSRLTQETSQKSAPTDIQIVRAVRLGSKWEMKQMRFDVDAGGEVAILLKLANNDKVDGYFYLERGESINFHVMGKTQLFESEAQDRFAFVATEAEGDTYTLTFRNTAKGESLARVTIFLEVIYPIGGSLYVPVEGQRP